jgi:hypothetical protein
MVRVFKIGVVVALVLTTTVAMGSNFRAADQVYLPAAAFAAGASGTFISDIAISNLSPDSIDISVIYAASASPAGPTNLRNFDKVVQLAPNERKEFVNFVQNTLQMSPAFGQLIFNACLRNADCGPLTQDQFGVSPNFRNISVESRIYSIPAGTTLAQNPATTGQLFSGLPWYNFVSQDQAANGLDKVFITGLRNNGTTCPPNSACPGAPACASAGTYRGNLGLVNASQYSSTDIVVRLFNGNGTQIGNDFVQHLEPLGHVQPGIGTLFSAFNGATAINAYVTVEQRNSRPTSDAPASCQPNGCPGFFAYGSVLDNQTGDATTLEAQYLKPLNDAALVAIYGSGAGKTSPRRSVHH